jgi:hypothetical protein
MMTWKELHEKLDSALTALENTPISWMRAEDLTKEIRDGMPDFELLPDPLNKTTPEEHFQQIRSKLTELQRALAAKNKQAAVEIIASIQKLIEPLIRP